MTSQVEKRRRVTGVSQDLARGEKRGLRGKKSLQGKTGRDKGRRNYNKRGNKQPFFPKLPFWEGADEERNTSLTSQLAEEGI